MTDVLDDKVGINANSLGQDNFELSLGEQNKAYYLGAWESLKNQRIKISFNGSAFLFGAFWLTYRKMYFSAFALTYVLASIVFIQLTFNFSLFHCLALDVLPFLYLGLFGNWHYYKYIEKTNSRILQKEMDRDFEIIKIIKEGGVNTQGILALIGYWIFLGILIVGFSTFFVKFSFGAKISLMGFILLNGLIAMISFRDKGGVSYLQDNI
jgi:hypothetical protein